MLNKNDIICTGCGACYNICPVNAITMQGDEYGFYKPQIDQEKCINCGLCEKTCPLDNYKSKNDEPKAYALINKDETTRLKCASGGAFSAFAKLVLEQNGIVYGVIWNDDIVAIHSRAKNIEQLEKMYSSKYVQANTLDTFKQAKKDLEDLNEIIPNCNKQILNEIIKEILEREDLFDSKKQGFINNLKIFKEKYNV